MGISQSPGQKAHVSKKGSGRRATGGWPGGFWCFSDMLGEKVVVVPRCPTDLASGISRRRTERISFLETLLENDIHRNHVMRRTACSRYAVKRRGCQSICLLSLRGV